MNEGLRFPVSAQKAEALRLRMAELGILEADLEEQFIRGSGKGGQKINKVSSCVQLVHRPTGISVRCQKERSQSMNRFLARRELCDRIEARQRGFVEKEQAEVSKRRRQKARRSRRTKQKLREAKQHRAGIKAGRSSSFKDD